MDCRNIIRRAYPRVSAQMTATATIVNTATVDHSEKRPMVVAIACPQMLMRRRIDTGARRCP